MGKIIIGIDPGGAGGIAIISSADKILVHKMPETPRDLYDLLKRYSKTDCICFLEKVQGLPGMGGAAMFTFGRGFGHLEMCLLALEIKTETVTPQKWQKTFQLGTKGTRSTSEWKNVLKAKAQLLFPKFKFTLWSADAALIAEYGRRCNL